MKNLELEQLETRRKQICEAIAAIRTMRPGTLNEVYNHPKLKDGTKATSGPFYNITVKKNNKTVTVSVPKGDLDIVRKEVQNYKDFRALSDEYVSVCEQISLLASGRGQRKD